MDIKQIIRVVLVSPNDVTEERQAVEEAVRHAAQVASAHGVGFELKRWEDIGPGFNPGGPQALIDSQLAIEKCDLLIGIFWKRFGVVDEPPYSRTAREVLSAFEIQKISGTHPELAIYFCDRPYNPVSPDEAEQQRDVLKFRQELSRILLYKQYQTVQAFSMRVLTDLLQCLNKLTAPSQLWAFLASHSGFVRAEGYVELASDLLIHIVGAAPPETGESLRVGVTLTVLGTSFTNSIAEDGFLSEVILLSTGKDGLPLSHRGRQSGPNSISFEDVLVSVRAARRVEGKLTVKGVRFDLTRFVPGAFITGVAEVTLGDKSILALEAAHLGISAPAFELSVKEAVGSSVQRGDAYEYVRLFTAHFEETFPGAFKTRQQEGGGSESSADYGTVVSLSFNLPFGFNALVTLYDILTDPVKEHIPRAIMKRIPRKQGRPLEALNEPIQATWCGRTPMILVKDEPGLFPPGWEIIGPPSGWSSELVIGIAIVGPKAWHGEIPFWGTLWPHYTSVGGGDDPKPRFKQSHYKSVVRL